MTMKQMHLRELAALGDQRARVRDAPCVCVEGPHGREVSPAAQDIERRVCVVRGYGGVQERVCALDLGQRRRGREELGLVSSCRILSTAHHVKR